MIFNPSEIQQLFSIIDYRLAVIVAQVLGKEFLTPEDLYLLKSNGFDLEKEIKIIPPYWQAFLFGRLSPLLSPQQLSTLNYDDVDLYIKKDQYEALTSQEKAEYHAAATRSYSYIKGMGTRIKDSLTTSISEEEIKAAVAEREAEEKGVLKEEITIGVIQKRAVKNIVSRMGHRLDDWNRDWGRIVETELQDIYQLGIAQTIMKKHGTDAKVYKQVFPKACKECIHLYTTGGIGSKPRVFTISGLIANGSNIGRKRSGWLSVLGPVHPFCFDKQTEVLTNEGWKFFKDLDKKELFLSVDLSTNQLEWRSAIRWVNELYEGAMIHRTSRSYDLMTTPNHFHVGHSRKNKALKLTKETDLVSEFSFAVAGFDWKGKKQDYIVFDNHQYDMKLFCQFMGYFLSEGSVFQRKDCKTRVVSISQHNPIFKEKMFQCCSSLIKGSYISKTGITCPITHEEELFNYLKGFGHAFDKYIPEEIKNLSVEYLQIFLDAFREGDGTVRKSKSYEGYVCKPEVLCLTSSPKLCSDIGEILIKLGKRPSYRNFGKAIAFDKKQNKTYTSNHDNWRIRELSSVSCSRTAMKEEIINYSDYIYDVELDKNNTLFVRRNGKVCLSGNCRCETVYIPEGYVWDDENQIFVPSPSERKVERKSKVKITVGNRYFEV